MTLRAELRVKIHGDKLVEGRVYASVQKLGVRVDSVVRRRGGDGAREHRLTISFEPPRSLGDISKAVESVQGAVLVVATLLPSQAVPPGSLEHE